MEHRHRARTFGAWLNDGFATARRFARAPLNASDAARPQRAALAGVNDCDGSMKTGERDRGAEGTWRDTTENF